jgi:hypothetical protein
MRYRLTCSLVELVFFVIMQELVVEVLCSGSDPLATVGPPANNGPAEVDHRLKADIAIARCKANRPAPRTHRNKEAGLILFKG